MAEGVITTDVDALMALVERQKKISLDDAAKQLNQSPQAIENLATFLEEEKLLEIKYQFTTPYLHWKEAVPQAKKGAPAPQKAQPLPLPTAVEEKKILSADEAQEALRQVYTLLSQGKIADAKQLYKQIHDHYEHLPRAFITAKKELEQELVKLNAELTTVVERTAAAKARDNQAKIDGLVEQAQNLLKTGDWKMAAKVYNEIKALYRDMPRGFVKERTELAEKVLGLYESLTSAHHEHSRKEMDTKVQELHALLGQLRNAMASHEMARAMQLYHDAKEKYTLLPAGYLEEKLALQEQMIALFRDLSVTRRTLSQAEMREKVETITRFLDQINDALAKQDVSHAVGLYREVHQLFAALPPGFTAEQRNVHTQIIRTYRRLLRARREHSLVSLKFSGGKINELVTKAKYYLANKQTDLAFQLYTEIIDEYSNLPEGYEKDKAAVRDGVYNLYYELVSGTDIAQLGSLDDYTKERYFGLLKLLVTLHKVIDAGEFPLLTELYSSIHRLYNDLPLKVVQQKGRLVQEVTRVYTLIKIYEAVERLEQLLRDKKHDDLRETLGFLGVEIIKAGRESPEDKMLLNYAKDRYLRYMELLEGRREEVPEYAMPTVKKESAEGAQWTQLAKPVQRAERQQLSMKPDALMAREENLFGQVSQQKQALQQREGDIRARIDHLSRCKMLFEQAQSHVTQKNYTDAVKVLGQLLALEPNYPNARSMMVNLEKVKTDEYRRELLASLVKSKKEKAIVRLAEHDYDGAIASIQSILELDPTNVEARYMLQTAKAEMASRGR
ncbi:hypothetical protein HY639_04340 [Candidatus Woesearchaeota archaeon]|nr:hypothetical protein [Candidatus Woesearchaeota archaeon]